MKSLKELLYKVPIEAIIGKTDVSVKEIGFDSRRIDNKHLYVAIKGHTVNGHDFINEAILKGACAIICEVLPQNPPQGIVFVQVLNTSEALSIIAANFYDNPSSQLKLIGVTGTNGKTTIATLLYQLFEKEGYSSGLLSTIAVRYAKKEFPATHTTPDSIQINQHLRKMVDAGVRYCFMEVSSHGIAQCRTMGLQFSGGIFTNLTHDHLDYHKTFKAYRDVKKTFFDQLPPEAFALTNADDKNGRFMLQNTVAKKYTYGLSQLANFTGRILESRFSGMLMKINNQELWVQLVGNFNAANLMAIYGTATLLGMEELSVLKQMSDITNVPGRFQTFPTEDAVVVIVDYAHTPDALENTLKAIHSIRTQNESLITVIGCGGDRDKKKRPLMAKVATQYSNKVIFTADNPRNEDPSKIIDEMMEGVPAEDYKKALRVTHRAEAIAVAKQLCNPNDIVLIGGKGHENYQEIKGERIPFDDFEVAQKIFLKT